MCCSPDLRNLHNWIIIIIVFYCFKLQPSDIRTRFEVSNDVHTRTSLFNKHKKMKNIQIHASINVHAHFQKHTHIHTHTHTHTHTYTHTHTHNQIQLSKVAFTPDVNEALRANDLHVKSMQRRDRQSCGAIRANYTLRIERLGRLTRYSRIAPVEKFEIWRIFASTLGCSLQIEAGLHLGRGCTCRPAHNASHWLVTK